jgi:hypothetical protein
MRQIRYSIRAEVVLAKGYIYAGVEERMRTISKETEWLSGNLGLDYLKM